MPQVEIEPLIRKYLQAAYMMQTATMSGNQTWICTIYFAARDLREDARREWRPRG